MHTCVWCTCEGQRMTLGVSPQVSPTFCLIQGLSLTGLGLGHVGQTNWPPDSRDPPLSFSELQAHTTASGFFHMGPRDSNSRSHPHKALQKEPAPSPQKSLMTSIYYFCLLGIIS